jgi:hypothetical protein
MRRSLVHQAWPVLTALPASPVDGQEIYFQADAGPPAVVWHLRRRASKWEFVGGPPIVYRMEGENNGYVPVSSGNIICVNPSSKLLQWVFTPPVDEPADLRTRLGLNAGTTYTINVVWTSSGGAAFSYYQGPASLQMLGEAWPR